MIKAGLALTAVLMTAAVLLIFLWTGRAAGLGLDFKIFFFHVPVAWLMFLSALTAGVSAVWHLAKHTPDHLSASAAELAFVFGLMVLTTGPIWAWKAWGKPWIWEPRLTTSLICWLTFAVAVLTRRFGGAEGSRMALALSILGAANVPVVYLSVKFWAGGHHPPTSVVPTLEGRFAVALAVSLMAFTLLWILLLIIGVRQRKVARQVEESWARANLSPRQLDRQEK
jgi:heme exporter protein C